MSTSQENMTKEDREREAMYRQYITKNYSQTPIKDEGIFGFEPDGSFRCSKIQVICYLMNCRKFYNYFKCN